jgi:hypothetical protein
MPGGLLTFNYQMDNISLTKGKEPMPLLKKRPAHEAGRL